MKDQDSLARSSGSEVSHIGEYKILRRGSLKYIVDFSGNIVSDGYHSFSIFRQEDDNRTIVGLIGELGAMKYALNPPTAKDNHFRASPEGFHDLVYRKDLGNRFVISRGAAHYLVDSVGKIISKGYHEFAFKDGKIFGIIGSHIEEVALSEDVVDSLPMNILPENKAPKLLKG